MAHDDAPEYPDWSDLRDPDPQLTATVELTFPEIHTLLEWAYHLEAYTLDSTLDIIPKLERARAQIDERTT